MDRIDHVEHILAELGIPSSFSVIQKYEERDQKHCPLIIKTQINIK